MRHTHQRPATTGAEETDAAAAPSWTRRALLLGGVGAGIATVAGAQPASATSGQMIYGGTNFSDDLMTTLSSWNPEVTLFVTNSDPVSGTGGKPRAIWGIAPKGTGVVASGTHGLRADGSSGPGVAAHSASGPSLQLSTGLAGVPATGTWTAGALVETTAGELWLCVTSGTPGAWRRLAGPTSAGDYVSIEPTRVHDSRLVAPFTKIAPGAPRVVSCKDGRNVATGAVTVANLVPAGTRAITANVTVTGTDGPGWIAVASGDAVAVTASSVNYGAANVSVANGLTLRLNASRQVKIFASSSATHVIIDVSGYYRSA